MILNVINLNFIATMDSEYHITSDLSKKIKNYVFGFKLFSFLTFFQKVSDIIF